MAQILGQNLTWATGLSSQTLSHRRLQYRTTSEDRSLHYIEKLNLKLGIGSHKNQPCFDVTMWWYRVLMYQPYRHARYRGLYYRTYRSVRCRYRSCTDTGTNCGSDVHTGTGCAGIDVPNLPIGTVAVLMYRTYRSIRHRY